MSISPLPSPPLEPEEFIIPPNDNFFSYDTIPRLRNCLRPIYDLAHIPPLVTRASLQKQVNSINEENKTKKKIRYNPEVSMPVSSAPKHLSEQDFIVKVEKPLYCNKYSYAPNLIKTARTADNQNQANFIVKEEIQAARNQDQGIKVCDENSTHEFKYQTSLQIQHALQALQQKIANSPQSEDEEYRCHQKIECKASPSWNSEAKCEPGVTGNNQANIYKSEASCRRANSTTEESSDSSEVCDADQRVLKNYVEMEMAYQMQIQMQRQAMPDMYPYNNRSQDLLVMKPMNFSSWMAGPSYMNMMAAESLVQRQEAEIAREIQNNQQQRIVYEMNMKQNAGVSEISPLERLLNYNARSQQVVPNRNFY